MDKLPWYKFNVMQFLGGDIQAATMEEQGIFVNICARLWDKNGYISSDIDILSQLLKVEKTVLISAIKTLEEELKVLKRNKNSFFVGFILRELKEAKAAHQKRVNAGRMGGKIRTLPHPSKAQAKPKQSLSKQEGDIDREKEIYQAYPRKQGEPSALRAITKALKQKSFDDLLALSTKYAEVRKGQNPDITPLPATWYNDARYNDDPATWLDRKGSSQDSTWKLEKRKDALDEQIQAIRAKLVNYTAEVQKKQYPKELQELLELKATRMEIVKSIGDSKK